MTHLWSSTAWLVLPELAPDWDGSQETESDLDDTDGLSHFTIKSGTVSLDRSRVPFAQADLVVAIESPQVTGAYWSVIPDGVSVAWLYMGPVEGPFQQVNLLIRGASADYAQKELTLTLEGAEMALQDYAALNVDYSQAANQGSLNDLVAAVVDLAGYSLDASVPTDVDMTLRSTAVNQVANPRGQSGGTAWTVGGTVTIGTTPFSPAAPNGQTSGQTLTTTANSSPTFAQTTFSGTAGHSYLVGAYVWTTYDSPTGWYLDVTANGNVAYDGPNTPTFSLSTSTWTWVLSGVQGPLPASQEYNARVVATTNPGATGRFLAIAGMTVVDVADLPKDSAGNPVFPTGGFDGATAADTHYTYAWNGTVNASPSTRTPDFDNKNALVWPAGVSAWDFLQGLVNTAKRRLFADETGVFHLVDPDTYSLPGSVILNEMNSTGLTDAVDGSAGLGNATGIVVKYKPLPDGTPVTDSAGTPEKVLVIDFTDRDSPGPGAAANILARRSSNGRSQAGVTVPNWTVRPSMSARFNYTNPNFPDGDFSEIGLVQSIEWDLATGLMTVTPSALLDAAPGSWLAVDDSLEWSAVSGSLQWNGWT